jgi:hypothetical protein
VSTGLPRPSECRDCADPIRFVNLPSGKSLPVNPGIAPAGRGTVAARLVMTTAGRQLRGFVIAHDRQPDPHNPLRFTVHAATCKALPRNTTEPARPVEVDAPLF